MEATNLPHGDVVLGGHPASLDHEHPRTIGGHRHALAPQLRELPGGHLGRARAVRPQDPMPRHLSTVTGHYCGHLAGSTAPEEFRDIAVGQHPAVRNTLDQIEHTLRVR